MAMSATVIIRGSWGNIVADRTSGAILAYNECDDLGDDETGYHDILYILPETLAAGRDDCLDRYGETDILCVGFVDCKGFVTMPMVHDGDGFYVDPLLLN